MNENYLSEKIGAIKNEMSHLWGGAFVMGGGAITLATTEINILKLVFIVSGLIMTVIFINAYFIRKQEISDTLKD